MSSVNSLRERVKRHMAEQGLDTKTPEELRRLAEEAQRRLEAIPINRPAAQRVLRVVEGRAEKNG